MVNGSARYMFAGHAIGAAAQFDRLDDQENLNHVIPALGSSVLPLTGGRSEARAGSYRYDVDNPRRRNLFSVTTVNTWVEGRGNEAGTETEVNVEVGGLDVVEKLRIDAVRLHLLSIRKPGAAPVVSTKGTAIDGMRLADVEARVTFDYAPLNQSGTAAQFAAWHEAEGRLLELFGDYHRGTIVSSIELIGDGPERQNMSLEGKNIIRWKGFGRIILGEIHVKGHERRVTMVRLAMGSNAGGNATVGEGQTNGELPGG